MATPVYSFLYPATDTRFFVIHNSYFELPETMPMDLTTFVLYHIESGRSFEGLFFCYSDIVNNGCSLFNTTYEEFTSEFVRKYHLDTINDFNLLEVAVRNKTHSDRLNSILINKDSIQSFYNAIDQIDFEINPEESYVSLHATWEWLDSGILGANSELIQNKCPKCEFTSDLREKVHRMVTFQEEVYAHFIESHGMPLELMPFVYRKNSFYIARCKEEKLDFLLYF